MWGSIFDACFRREKTSKVGIKLRTNMDCHNREIIDCQFMSSHNSYISDLQFGYSDNESAILKVINMGFRCIEIDVAYTNKPVITHLYSEADLATSSVSDLDGCLKVIKENAFKYFMDPLFIAVEDNTNDKIDVYDYVEKYLGGYHVKDEETFKHLKIRDILGKVIVIRRGFWSNNSTNDIINEPDRVIRVYPVFDFKTALSFNDPRSMNYLKNGANFVAINCGVNDKTLDEYNKYFGDYSIIAKKH